MEIDTSCFKAFQAAAQTLNFTEAARVSGMTQSGVSQHVAKLERDLDSPLFLRIGKKVLLTESGKNLLAFIDRHQEHIDSLFENLHLAKSQLKGLVRYSMPDSCLLSPHFSMLLNNKMKNFPEVELRVFLHHSEEVLREVLANEIDFGFMTKKILNDELHYEEFCAEEYVLVGAKAISIGQKDLNTRPWIQYPGFETIAEKWMLGQSGKVKNHFNFKFSGQTNSLRAALTMVSHGMGLTIIPRHCVDSFDDKKNIKIIEEGFKLVNNQIYIVTLKGISLPMRVKKVIEVFRSMK